MEITLQPLLLLACMSVCVHRATPERRHIYVDHPLKQQEAQRYCRCHNGNLSSVLTLEDKVQLRNLNDAWTWVGLSLGPQSWQWTDGSRAAYFNWKSPREGCGAVTAHGLWVSRQCNASLPFLCQDVTTGAYELQEDSLTWTEALAHCLQLGMTLASFRSPSSSSPGRWPSSPHWIGLWWLEGAAGWAWVGELGEVYYSAEYLAYPYTNWQTRLYCAVMDTDGGWRDAQCDEQHQSLCAGPGTDVAGSIPVAVYDRLTWREAQSRCESNGMVLVTVRDADENTLLRHTLAALFRWEEEVWIGLSNNPWEWADGSSGGEDANWKRGEPNNYPIEADDIEGCAVMNEGTLYDVSCSLSIPFFCQIAPVKPQLVSAAALAPSSWEEALLHCRGLGGDLATVAWPHAQTLLMQAARAASTAHVWMGLRFLAGEWLWVCGGRPLPYLNWRDPWGEGGEATTCPAQHCGAVERDTGLWVPRSCDENLDFLCQVP